MFCWYLGEAITLFILCVVTLLTSCRNRQIFFWLLDFLLTIMTSISKDSFDFFFFSQYCSLLFLALFHWLRNLTDCSGNALIISLSLVDFLYQVKQASFHSYFTDSSIFSQDCQDDCSKSSLVYTVYVNFFLKNVWRLFGDLLLVLIS